MFSGVLTRASLPANLAFKNLPHKGTADNRTKHSKGDKNQALKEAGEAAAKDVVKDCQGSLGTSCYFLVGGKKWVYVYMEISNAIGRFI